MYHAAVPVSQFKSLLNRHSGGNNWNKSAEVIMSAGGLNK